MKAYSLILSAVALYCLVASCRYVQAYVAAPPRLRSSARSTSRSQAKLDNTRSFSIDSRTLRKPSLQLVGRQATESDDGLDRQDAFELKPEPGLATNGAIGDEASKALAFWVEDMQRKVSQAGYKEIWEGSAMLQEGSAYAAWFIAATQKIHMMERVAAGKTPLNDSWNVEYAGRLLPGGSGICYPFEQVFLAVMLAVALTGLIWDTMNEDTLSFFAVDIDTNRSRKSIAAMVFLACTVIISLPPQPMPGATLF